MPPPCIPKVGDILVPTLEAKPNQADLGADPGT